jgi:hypothetical protein
MEKLCVCYELRTVSLFTNIMLQASANIAPISALIFRWYFENTHNAVAQLFGALRYKPEGRGFDSRWLHWNFLLT